MGDENARNRVLRESLRGARVARGLSQQVVADFIGIGQSRLSEIENGRAPAALTPEQLERAGIVLEVHPVALLGYAVPRAVEVVARIEPLVRLADDLTDGDVEVLAGVARHLTSVRASARGAVLRQVAEQSALYTVTPEETVRRLVAVGLTRERAERAVQAALKRPRTAAEPETVDQPAAPRRRASSRQP